MAVASTAKERRPRRKRNRTVLEQLIAGCEAERVSVHFLNGDVKEGALLYNTIKRSGKLINIQEEFSVDFETHQVKSIRVLAHSTDAADLEGAETAEAESGDDSEKREVAELKRSI